MTAEVAIMNKQAVALAADSAVTVSRRTGPKIYNTVNKLFRLSEHQPLGAMFYGAAELLGVPWETIIKTYRQHLGATALASVDDYADDLMSFLEQHAELFPQVTRQRYVPHRLLQHFHKLRERVNEHVGRMMQAKGQVTDAEVRRTVTQVIREDHERIQGTRPLDCMASLTPRRFLREYDAPYRDARQRAFQKLPISELSERRLRAIATGLFLKDDFSGEHSGIVIAGFGANQVFPSLVCLLVDGILEGRIRYLKERSSEITADNSGCIMAFAQREMVHTFMEGADPDYLSFAAGYVGFLFGNYYREILKAIPTSARLPRAKLREKLKAAGKKLAESFEGETKTYRGVCHVQPVMDAVTALPKDELAAMAEALVNLTSFKRRMSMESETVGGPIDVAVISKGDGFVWINHKHYFRPELNPRFLARYQPRADRDTADGG